uniref:G_PROTEIN_RECEP_F2_3 domain-containing protein n=1 Tax=Ascaris lumbricoides TaxID=6252 RepID=A0A0M3IVS1_ASCLU
MEFANETTVTLIFTKLNKLFTLHPANATINKKRALQFARLCAALNEFSTVPDGFCPFYFDQVSCWNATPPQTTARMRCVSWQFDRPNPG